MSASLVGSEMCIRDSPTRWRRPSTVETAEGLRAHAGRSRVRGKHYPVSYTHLTLPTICSV
eukprot:4523573-Alexandrium_andersonii.AAC.1